LNRKAKPNDARSGERSESSSQRLRAAGPCYV